MITSFHNLGNGAGGGVTRQEVQEMIDSQKLIVSMTELGENSAITIDVYNNPDRYFIQDDRWGFIWALFRKYEGSNQYIGLQASRGNEGNLVEISCCFFNIHNDGTITSPEDYSHLIAARYTYSAITATEIQSRIFPNPHMITIENEGRIHHLNYLTDEAATYEHTDIIPADEGFIYIEHSSIDIFADGHKTISVTRRKIVTEEI